MLITIVTFFVILGILVFVHELGHFVVARSFKVKCDEFGFGFPPRIIGWVKNEPGSWQLIKGKNKNADGEERQYSNTIYSLNWLPLGGFVKIKGEQGDSADEKDSFSHQKLWKRALILSSGVTMNFILAMTLFSIGFIFGIPQVLDDTILKNAVVREEKIQIISVQKDSPAEKGSLEIGDSIISVDGQAFNKIEALQKYIREGEEKEITVVIKRGNETHSKIINPKTMPVEDEKSERAMGVILAKTGIVSYPFFTAIWQGIATTLNLMKLIIQSFYYLLKDLIITHKVSVDVAGPVGIAVVTGQVVRMGFIYILQFAALLSINLGIINFFPFPALDGGRVIGLGVEAVRRKPNNAKIEALIHNIGFGILMALVVLVTYRDMAKFGGKILERVFG